MPSTPSFTALPTQNTPQIPGGQVYVRGTGNPQADQLQATNYAKPLSQSNPLPGQNYFDPSVDKALIPGEQALSGNIGGLLSYGLDSAGANAPFQGGASDNDPMVQALKQRSQAQLTNATAGLKNQIAANTPVQQSRAEGQIGSQAQAEYQNQVQNFNEQYAYEMQRYNLLNQYQIAQAQAQQGLLGAIFGGLGAIGGAVIGGAIGGPGGAMAGAMAGSKA